MLLQISLIARSKPLAISMKWAHKLLGLLCFVDNNPLRLRIGLRELSVKNHNTLLLYLLRGDIHAIWLVIAVSQYVLLKR